MRSVRKLFLVAGLASLTLLATAQAPAAAADGAVPVAAPASTLVGAHSEGGTLTAGPCVFITDGDRVHISSTPPAEASGHGWWKDINCKASTAVVTIELQELYSDGSWRKVGTVGKSTVKSGGGSGNRATARGTCTNLNETGWRSVIDVDLVGQPDSPEKVVTEAVNLKCRRYS